MSKRRRTSSIASSRGQEEDSLDSIEASSSSGPTMRKRRKKQDPMELVQQVYDSIRSHKKDDGTLLCDAFIRIPKRRQAPDYYELVSNPIDLLKVQQKLKTDEYEDIEDLQSDIELIVSNAKAFYKKTSQEYKDACDLMNLFNVNKARIIDGKSPKDTDDERTPRRNATANNIAATKSIRGRPRKHPLNHNHHNNDSVVHTTRRSRNAAETVDSEDTSRSSMATLDDSLDGINLGAINAFEELFTAIMTATDGDGKPLHTEFQLLPSRKKYPKYYECTDNPIDLRMIATKIQAGTYRSLIEMDKDVQTLTKNACVFNEPGSLIYKHAKVLRRIVQQKRMEMEHNGVKLNVCTSKSERIRNRKLRGAMSLSAITAALRDDDEDDSDDDSDVEEEEEDAEEEEEADDDAEEEEDDQKEEQDDDQGSDISEPDNPKWKLFEAVKSVTGPGGASLSEPFWRLPSRRFYADYYKEIKNPLSLTQIKRKLMSHLYGTVSEVAGDLTILFENAKRYNVETSKLYKDAVKLQKVMQLKLQELLDIDQDFDTEVEPEYKKRGPKPKNHIHTPAPRGRPPKDSIPMKKRLHTIAKILLDYKKADGRQPLLAFVEKPSKKLYPDYYDVIADPIDFLDIEAKIKGEQYSNEHEMVRDFKTMFSNCRTYNETNSPLYDDACLLEKVLLEKVSTLTPSSDKKPIPRVPKPRRVLTPNARRCKQLFETIREYREPKANRQLSTIFLKLPSKNDYPDYYEVIERPMDLERIGHKAKMGKYHSLDDIVADIILMFDNACKFNEPDSQVYKDALVLQHLTLQTKRQLKQTHEENTDAVPDVQAAVQDLLMDLFTSVYNHQDLEERCYTDSLSELPEHDEIDGKKIRGLSLDLIKRRLDKGLYKRLDAFQDDLFSCFQRARKLSRTDSQVFEDTLELQQFFIKQRDEICRNGQVLRSPALIYTQPMLLESVESQKQQKRLQESLEEENETRSSDDSIIKENNVGNGGETMTCNQKIYKVGDFIYLEAKEKSCDPHIILIERLFTTSGKQMLYGNNYLRPAETYHVSTRKFLECEVFKSDSHVTIPLEEVRGRCCVISVKQYFTMRPEGFDDKDVYVSESRYSSRMRSFKKIKIFRDTPNPKLILRETPIVPKRVMSVFRERVEKHKDELAELQEIERLVDRDRPNVIAFSNMEINDGNTYYEQYNTVCSGILKTGDFVYVIADGGRQAIAQINSIWDTKDGKSYFRGPWFVSPAEIPPSPTRLFYKQEVFLSTIEDTNPIVSILGKCSVLDYNEFIASRVTEVPENDVFICTSMFDEINRQVKRLTPEGFRKFKHNGTVTEDEVYYFSRLLNPPKEASPLLTKLNDMDVVMEDSLDGGPPSVGSGEVQSIPTTPGTTTTIISTPVTAKKKVNKTKIVTGYILYSRDVRKIVCQTNPESNFGEISKIVGNDWRGLAPGVKQSWEEKAIRMNEEAKERHLMDEQCNSPAPPPPPDQIFECLWDNCDYQFEEISDCIEHCIRDKETGGGHVQSYFVQNQESELNCFWRGCGRHNKKNVQPFPNMARLTRHVRDMHINKGNGRSVVPESRSKNFKPSSKMQNVRATPTATPAPSASIFNTTASTYSAASSAVKIAPVPAPAPVVPPKQYEPMFITVPPRPQRALHSEAYIKYIEGLHAENKYISPWERTLTVTQEQVPAPDAEKLQSVITWLGPKASQSQDNVVNALWTLRNQLLKDAIGLQKTL